MELSEEQENAERDRRAALLRRIRCPRRLTRAIEDGVRPDQTEVAIARDALAVRGLHAVIPKPDVGWPLLIVEGQLCPHPRVAVVGARALDPYGESVTVRSATEVVMAGATIVSGGAVGADAMAHRVALDSAERTVVVIAGGHDHLYPRDNVPLFRQAVASGGAVVSPWWPDTPVAKHRFLMRNRLIAALVKAVIVTRARRRSGALVTAEAALSSGRAVLAVPGSVGEVLSAGPHHLLALGASPMLGPGSLTRVLGGDREGTWSAENRPGPRAFTLDPTPWGEPPCAAHDERDERQVLELCASGPLDVAQLIHRSGLTIARLMAALGHLQYTASIERLSDGTFACVRGR